MLRRIMLLVILLVLLVGPMPFSRVEQCLRPADVMTTARIFDPANGTWIQYFPTEEACDPLYAGGLGLIYIRLQWRNV